MGDLHKNQVLAGATFRFWIVRRRMDKTDTMGDRLDNGRTN